MSNPYTEGPYDPATFWESHAAETALWEERQPDAPEIREMVRYTKPVSVLELGCGPGRNTPLFSVSRWYLGVDISSTYITRAADRNQGRMFMRADIADLAELADGFDDLVFADSTMQHLTPDTIAGAVAEAFRVSSRYVCFIEYTEADEAECPYCNGQGWYLWHSNEHDDGLAAGCLECGGSGGEGDLVKGSGRISGAFFDQIHLFPHDYAALAEPYGRLLWRTDIAEKVQPARKELFLWEKR